MAVAQRGCVVAGYLFLLLLAGCKARIHKLTLTVSRLYAFTGMLARELIDANVPDGISAASLYVLLALTDGVCVSRVVVTV